MSLCVFPEVCLFLFFFFFQAEDGIRDYKVTGVQTCALPISVVAVRQLRGGDGDAGGGGRPTAGERRDADLIAAQSETYGAGGGGAAGAGYGCGDGDRIGRHYRGRCRL